MTGSSRPKAAPCARSAVKDEVEQKKRGEGGEQRNKPAVAQGSLKSLENNKGVQFPVCGADVWPTPLSTGGEGRGRKRKCARALHLAQLHRRLQMSTASPPAQPQPRALCSFTAGSTRCFTHPIHLQFFLHVIFSLCRFTRGRVYTAFRLIPPYRILFVSTRALQIK